MKMEKILQKIYLTKLQFIENARFTASSSSNLVNNLSDVLYRIKCKLGHDDKKCETSGFKYSIVTVSSNIQTLKMI